MVCDIVNHLFLGLCPSMDKVLDVQSGSQSEILLNMSEETTCFVFLQFERSGTALLDTVEQSSLSGLQVFVFVLHLPTSLLS
jgi:hypothetical protein